MKSSIKKTLLYMPFSILGNALIAFGIAMYLCVNLGADPASVFATGLVKAFGFSGTYAYTMGSYILQAACLALLFWKGRHLLGAATIVAMLLFGLFVDWFTPPLAMIISPDFDIAWRVAIYVLATIIIGCGCGLYLSTGLGGSPIDTLPLMLDEHSKMPFRYIRMIYDATLLGVGILLGSTDWGVGTVITCVLMGPVSQFFMGMFKPMFERSDAKIKLRNRNPKSYKETC